MMMMIDRNTTLVPLVGRCDTHSSCKSLYNSNDWFTEKFIQLTGTAVDVPVSWHITSNAQQERTSSVTQIFPTVIHLLWCFLFSTHQWQSTCYRWCIVVCVRVCVCSLITCVLWKACQCGGGPQITWKSMIERDSRITHLITEDGIIYTAWRWL